jgi:hypothetical protein
VHSMPKPGLASTWRFAEAFGQLQGIVAALGIPLTWCGRRTGSAIMASALRPMPTASGQRNCTPMSRPVCHERRTTTAPARYCLLPMGQGGA